MALKIPIFLSCPSMLNATQQAAYDYLVEALDQERLLPRALGRSDFPQSDPVTEVYYIARACYGGIILGFSQIEARDAKLKGGTPAEAQIGPMLFPTPWNQIEAGILTALRRPLLVFAETGVSGGIFDQGAFPGFLQKLPRGSLGPHDLEQVRERIRIWSAQVRSAFRS